MSESKKDKKISEEEKKSRGDSNPSDSKGEYSNSEGPTPSDEKPSPQHTQTADTSESQGPTPSDEKPSPQHTQTADFIDRELEEWERGVGSTGGSGGNGGNPPWAEDVEPWGVESPVIPPQWRPVLPLIMLVILLAVGYSFLDEFTYTLKPRKAVDLGVVSDGCEDEFYRKIRHNSYVKVRGAIPQPGLSVKARVKFKERYYVVVLGCDLIISVTPERYQQLFAGFYQKVIVLDGDRGPLKGSERQEEVSRKGRDVPLYKKREVAGPPWIEGRALQFFSTPALDNIRHFYSRYLGVEFSENTYLIRDGEYPGQNWWLLLLFVGLLILVVYNLISFWRATKEYLEFKESLKQ